MIRIFSTALTAAVFVMATFGQTGSDPKAFPSELRGYLKLSGSQVDEISALNQQYCRVVREKEQQSEKLQRRRIQLGENKGDLEMLGIDLRNDLAAIDDKIQSVLNEDQRKRLSEIVKTGEPASVLSQAVEWHLVAGGAKQANAQQFGGTTQSFSSDTASRPTSTVKTQSKKPKITSPPTIPPPQ